MTIYSNTSSLRSWVVHIRLPWGAALPRTPRAREMLCTPGCPFFKYFEEWWDGKQTPLLPTHPPTHNGGGG